MRPQSIDIAQLLVNPENPRFEPVRDEGAAIDLMISEVGDEVFNLAKDIANHGMNPSKSLMVIKVGKKFLPLEGNRRVVALKLLHEPDLTTNSQYKTKFAQLKKDSGASIPRVVACVVFPDKESASRWVNLEHTGKNDGVGIVGWDSAQRQRFIAQYAGKTPSRSIQLIDYARENKITPDDVDSTTLERILGSPEVRRLIGVDFSGGLLEFGKPKTELINNLKKLFTAMSEKTFKVAKVYTKDKAVSWVANVLQLRPEPDKKARKTKAKTTSRANPLEGDWITAQLVSAYPEDNRVKAILRELHDLHPKKRPNVCATSLRLLLELALYEFLSDKGEIKKLIQIERDRIDEDNKKKKRKSPHGMPKDWAPSFHRTLSHLCTNEALMPDPQERKAVKTFIGISSSEPFLAELNQFTHNPKYKPTPDMVIAAWNNMGKLVFKAILKT